ncbi:phosphate signaling complex protein PhoU [Pseudonocardia sp. Cha107L01]|uniref:phosphate signaling complex protein PhoU n=1 Tax=Pseudonocardia sp. Cha107L01 TaxID=3457576 RepID=UPI00403ECCBB
MREIFHGQLEQLGGDLAMMCGLVSEAMSRASRGLLDTDLTLVEGVITDDEQISSLAAQCEEHACAMLALQAPVAKDLRTVITAIKAAEKINRMGDLARHVAEVARLRHPQPAVPAQLTDRFAEMARLGVQACNHLERSIAAPTGDDWPAMLQADDRVDQLQHEVVEEVSNAEPPYPIQVGVDVALLARYFERFADQAVSIARQLDYVVTGAVPEQPTT